MTPLPPQVEADAKRIHRRPSATYKCSACRRILKIIKAGKSTFQVNPLLGEHYINHKDYILNNALRRM